MNKRVFEVEVDGKPVKLAVVRPSHRVVDQGQLVYNRAFREAVTPSDGKPGALVRQKVEEVLREQNLWDDAKQARYRELADAVNKGELKLAMGANSGLTKLQCRDLALKMARDRAEIRRLTADRNRLDEVTAEARAEQARFNHYVAACTVYEESGSPYFRDAEDYLSREDDPAVLPAASNLGRLIYGLDDDYEKKLPENRFLLKYKFVDEQLRLVDKDGKFVDERGRPVDGRGRLVNERGELVDADGNLLTEDGEYKVEFREFDDEPHAA